MLGLLVVDNEITREVRGLVGSTVGLE